MCARAGGEESQTNRKDRRKKTDIQADRETSRDTPLEVHMKIKANRNKKDFTLCMRGKMTERGMRRGFLIGFLFYYYYVLVPIQ